MATHGIHNRRRRAVVATVSVLSVLLPAAGLAYVGAVSYREDRGIVAARLEKQASAASQVAAYVESALATTVTRVATTFERASTPGDAMRARAALEHGVPLAEQPFVIGRDAEMQYPSRNPLGRKVAAVLPRQTEPPCRRMACIKELRAKDKRAQLLQRAAISEFACGERTPCKSGRAQATRAQRLYSLLRRHDDVAPNALLGLARIARRRGDRATAIALYGELAERFGSRLDAEGVSYEFLAAVGSAEVSHDKHRALAVMQKLMARRYVAPPGVLTSAGHSLVAELSTSDSPDVRANVQPLRRALSEADRELSFAAQLQADVADVARSADRTLRSRRSASRSDVSYVFRAYESLGVVGIVATVAQLTALAATAQVELASVAAGARARVHAIGTPRPTSLRTLASATFGETLPHLVLEIVHDRSLPDPLDEIVRARGQRHLAITGGLVAVLVIALFASIRGAARERELARLKSNFVSTVSHELKTPLTSIRMFGEMLQQGVAGSDRQRETHYQNIIVKESQRLGLLITNLLDYSQIERGTQQYRQQVVVVGDLVDDVLATFDTFREDRQPPVEAMFGANARVAKLVVDREVLVQALLNLLENAVKYGGMAPIVVEVTCEGDDVCIAVIDQGPGIARSEHDKVFREFYRAPAARTSGAGGTGLGLALVKRHVEAQGGTVTLDSEEGRGATFTLRFTRHSRDDGERPRGEPVFASG